MFIGAPPIEALTATERSRVLRERRAAGKAVLTVVVGEDELVPDRQGRLRRGSIDKSKGPGSRRQLVSQRRGLGTDAMTASDGLGSRVALGDRPGKTVKSACASLHRHNGPFTVIRRRCTVIIRS